MPVTFSAESIGVPIPLMSWQKEGRMLSSDDRYRIHTDGGKSSLHIVSAKPDDNAIFQCTAVNVSGTSVNRAKLIVQGDWFYYLAILKMRKYIGNIFNHLIVFNEEHCNSYYWLKFLRNSFLFRVYLFYFNKYLCFDCLFIFIF